MKGLITLVLPPRLIHRVKLTSQLSGVIVRRGARLLGAEARSVLQGHTYAGSSTRALMAGQAVLEDIGEWAEHGELHVVRVSYTSPPHQQAPQNTPPLHHPPHPSTPPPPQWPIWARCAGRCSRRSRKCRRVPSSATARA